MIVLREPNLRQGIRKTAIFNFRTTNKNLPYLDVGYMETRGQQKIYGNSRIYWLTQFGYLKRFIKQLDQVLFENENIESLPRIIVIPLISIEIDDYIEFLNFIYTNEVLQNIEQIYNEIVNTSQTPNSPNNTSIRLSDVLNKTLESELIKFFNQIPIQNNTIGNYLNQFQILFIVIDTQEFTFNVISFTLMKNEYINYLNSTNQNYQNNPIQITPNTQVFSVFQDFSLNELNIIPNLFSIFDIIDNYIILSNNLVCSQGIVNTLNTTNTPQNQNIPNNNNFRGQGQGYRNNYQQRNNNFNNYNRGYNQAQGQQPFNNFNQQNTSQGQGNINNNPPTNPFNPFE